MLPKTWTCSRWPAGPDRRPVSSQLKRHSLESETYSQSSDHPAGCSRTVRPGYGNPILPHREAGLGRSPSCRDTWCCNCTLPVCHPACATRSPLPRHLLSHDAEPHPKRWAMNFLFCCHELPPLKPNAQDSAAGIALPLTWDWATKPKTTAVPRRLQALVRPQSGTDRVHW